MGENCEIGCEARTNACVLKTAFIKIGKRQPITFLAPNSLFFSRIVHSSSCMVGIFAFFCALCHHMSRSLLVIDGRSSFRTTARGRAKKRVPVIVLNHCACVLTLVISNSLEFYAKQEPSTMSMCLPLLFGTEK